MKIYLLQKVSSKCSASVGDSNPWDERCLAVAEMISCRGLRCEALIGIARRAHPPWSAPLKKAIQMMLDDRSLDNNMLVFLFLCSSNRFISPCCILPQYGSADVKRR